MTLKRRPLSVRWMAALIVLLAVVTVATSAISARPAKAATVPAVTSISPQFGPDGSQPPSSPTRHIAGTPRPFKNAEKEIQMSKGKIAGPLACAVIASAPSRRPAMSRRGFSLVSMCLIGALTVVSEGEASAIPATAAGSSSPNLVVNGNFAAPAVKASAGALSLSTQSQTGFTGWKVTAPAANLDASDYLNLAPGGSQAFVLDNGFGLPHTPNTGISQEVVTTPGSAYSLTLEYSATGQQGCPVGSVETGQAMWDGAVVATYSVTVRASDAKTHGAPPVYDVTWHSVQAVVTASTRSSTLALGWATTSCTPNIGAVSLTAVPVAAVTNGFSLLPITGAPVATASPYGTAERQVLTKLPDKYTISSAGVPIASIQASSAAQQPGGAGVLLTWSISPSPQFLKASSATETTYAGAVEKYVVSLLSTAHSDYLAALQAERVPPSSAKTPLASWWGVKVKATSTTNSAMSLQVTEPALPATTIAYTATGVPGVSGPATAASATGALKNLLYYTN